MAAAVAVWRPARRRVCIYVSFRTHKPGIPAAIWIARHDTTRPGSLKLRTKKYARAAMCVLNHKVSSSSSAASVASQRQHLAPLLSVGVCVCSLLPIKPSYTYMVFTHTHDGVDGIAQSRPPAPFLCGYVFFVSCRVCVRMCLYVLCARARDERSGLFHQKVQLQCGTHYQRQRDDGARGGSLLIGPLEVYTHTHTRAQSETICETVLRVRYGTNAQMLNGVFRYTSARLCAQHVGE